MGRGIETTVLRVAIACAVAVSAGCSGNASHLTTADTPGVREWREGPAPDTYQYRKRVHESGPPPFPGSVDPND